jgi:hypothetical protein
MSYELYFTSAPRGLRPGSSGFCTVAATRDMPAALVEKVELISGYRHLYPPLDPNNPVVYSHVAIEVLGKSYHVLSRVAAAGLDYSGRGNKFAHHVVLEPSELPPGGPAWLLAEPGFMATGWDGKVGYLAASRPLPRGEPPPCPCRAWERVTGDAGWAGVLLQKTISRPGQAVYCLYALEVALLPLLTEAISLLPAEQRWQITFNTYYTSIAPGISCLWRGVPEGTADVEKVRRQNPGAVFGISGLHGQAPAGAYVELARTGARQLATSMAGLDFAHLESPALEEVPTAETCGVFSAPDDDELLARVANPLPRTPLLIPSARQPGQAQKPPVPPGLSPPRLPDAKATAGFRWHTPSFALGVLCGCVLASAVAAGFWAMVLHQLPESDGTTVPQGELAKVTTPGKEASDKGQGSKPPQGVATEAKRDRAATKASNRDSEKGRGTDGSRPNVENASGSVKTASPAKAADTQAKPSARDEGPMTRAKDQARQANAMADRTEAAQLAVSGFLSIDPAANDQTILKSSGPGVKLSPQTRMELHCQKPTPNGIRFLASPRHVEVTRDRPAHSVLEIRYKAASDRSESELGEFAIAEDKLSFSWRNKVTGPDKTRKLFLEWCLLEIKNENQEKMLFALQQPQKQVQTKALTNEQGVFVLEPPKLSEWVGPELCLRSAEFVNAPQFKREADGNPRLMESEGYVITLKKRGSGPWFVEIWPKRGSREAPILKNLVVSTTIDDYRVEVYAFDRHGEVKNRDKAFRDKVQQ